MPEPKCDACEKPVSECEEIVEQTGTCSDCYFGRHNGFTA